MNDEQGQGEDDAWRDLCSQLPCSLDVTQLAKPTPMQRQLIPYILAGRSVLLYARAGTGKTTGFLVPVIANLVKQATSNPTEPLPLSVLVLVPTRELASHTDSVAQQLMPQLPQLKTAVLAGGAPLPPQLQRLQIGVQILFATPGRILEVARGNSSDMADLLAHIRMCVLEEVDTMVEFGFMEQQVVQVLALMAGSPPRQVLCYSATTSHGVEAFVQQVMDMRTLATPFVRLDG